MKYPIGIQSFESGYLTIKDVDRRFNTYLLDFPNTEVKQGMGDAFGQNKESTTSK